METSDKVRILSHFSARHELLVISYLVLLHGVELGMRKESRVLSQFHNFNSDRIGYI